MNTCDICGPGTPGPNTWFKVVNEGDGAPAVLTFCGHHSHAQTARLTAAGWTTEELLLTAAAV